MSSCKICHLPFNPRDNGKMGLDLCLACEERSHKIMAASYILARGLPGIRVEVEEVTKLTHSYTLPELMEMALAIKEKKYASGN